MSHFTDIETQIKDIDALRDACAEMKLALEQNAQARGYGSNKIHGDYVIRLRGPYDVALNRKADASYKLTADFWGEHVEREVGKGYGRLLQLYGTHKVMRDARRKGYRVKRTRQKNGHVVLKIGGAA